VRPFPRPTLARRVSVRKYFFLAAPHHSASDPDNSLRSRQAVAMGFWPSIGRRRAR